MARKAPEINAGSMADIAFLLLIFFLVTTTMDVDTGITRRLPPPVEDDQDIDVKERNVMKVLVNSRDRLMVNGKEAFVENLKDIAKDFMALHPNNPEYPEIQEKFIEELGREITTSKGVISLKNDRGTSYKMYIAVQNELAAAFNEMKDELSIEEFGVRYSQLIDERSIKGINKAVPIRVSEAEPEDIGGQ